MTSPAPHEMTVGHQMAQSNSSSPSSVQEHRSAERKFLKILVPKHRGISFFIQHYPIDNFVVEFITWNSSIFLAQVVGVCVIVIEEEYADSVEHAVKYTDPPAPIAGLQARYGEKYASQASNCDMVFIEYAKCAILDTVSGYIQISLQILLTTEQRCGKGIKVVYAKLKEKYPLLDINSVC